MKDRIIFTIDGWNLFSITNKSTIYYAARIKDGMPYRMPYSLWLVERESPQFAQTVKTYLRMIQ